MAHAVTLRRDDIAMLFSGTVAILLTLLTRTWGIHVDEILYFGYAIAHPLGDARIVGNHFLFYVFNYGLFHVLRGLAGGLAPLILPVFYAELAVISIWRLATATRSAVRCAWAFALMASSPFALFNSTQLMLETALISLLALTLASALAMSDEGFSRTRAFTLAVFGALCALTKDTALPALAVLAVSLVPVLGWRVWALLCGTAGGALVNRAVLSLIEAPSTTSYGGVGQLIDSLTHPSADRMLSFLGVWLFFAGLPSLAAAWSWWERRDRLSLSLLLLAWLSGAAAIVVQLATNLALPFPRYAYPVIWLSVAAGSLAGAHSRARWLAPLVLILQLPLATGLWPGVFATIGRWPSAITLEAFQNGGTILSGTPVHGWVAISGRARERLCVYMPRESPGALQAEPWFTFVAKDVIFFDASQEGDFRDCRGAKVVFDRRFDINACEVDTCSSSRYRIRSCLPQHIGFYSPRLGDVLTRVCLP